MIAKRNEHKWFFQLLLSIYATLSMYAIITYRQSREIPFAWPLFVMMGYLYYLLRKEVKEL